MQGILRKNIMIDLKAADRNDAIKQMINVLEANGHIDKSYYEDVLEREKTYPTGLPTEGVRIAIPHATSDAIIDSTIGVAVLKNPVGFYNMADDTEVLQVEVIFLIANDVPAEQTLILQRLTENFADEEILREIKGAASADEVFELLNRG